LTATPSVVDDVSLTSQRLVAFDADQVMAVPEVTSGFRAVIREDNLYKQSAQFAVITKSTAKNCETPRNIETQTVLADANG
jgi:hypothetical protein